MTLVMRRPLAVVLTLAFLAACEAEVPPPPPVTVVVSSVDYQSALADGIALALTATAQEPAPATETQLARLGVSLTPSLTPSHTPTPLPPTPTPQVTPSRPPPPSITPSPTFAPLAMNVIDNWLRNDAAGRLRVLNAWADSAVDVYLNDVRITRSLHFSGATAYHQLESEAVRVTITTSELTIGQVVAVPAGGSVSVLVADFGSGVTLRPVYEDVSTPPLGASRLTVVQANPDFLGSDVLLPEVQRALAFDLDVNEQAGPFDLPSRDYRLEFYDTDAPEALLTSLNALHLDGQVNYLLVMLPPQRSSTAPTDFVLFEGSAPRENGAGGVRFVNAATQPLSVQWGGQMQLESLDVGSLSVPLPLPPSGTKLTITDDQQHVIAEQDISPTEDDQLLVIHTDETNSGVEIAAFSQSAPPSTLNSHLRLINALPDIPALNLEFKVTDAALAATPADEDWEVLLDGIRYGAASSYTGLGTDLYDVRVTLAGTDTVIADMPEVQLLAGSIYDFVVVPGSESGSARLLLAQPDVQTGLALGQLDSLVVEQVQATLTALAPEVVSVQSDTPTPTPTITAVFTNTPHPTNTPSVRLPSLLIDPMPPQVAVGSFVLLGLDFAPHEDYVVSLVPSRRVLLRGVTDENGTLIADIILPANMPDGLYVIRVCVGCTTTGAQQEAFAAISAIFPTPSPMPRVTATLVPPTTDPSVQPSAPAPSGPPPPASQSNDDNDDDSGGSSPSQPPDNPPGTPPPPPDEPPLDEPPPPPDQPPDNPPPDEPPPPPDNPPDEPPPPDQPPDKPPDEPAPPPDEPPPDSGG